MKFDPNKLQTATDAQQALLDQGYETTDHPVMRHYDSETGKMTAEARKAFGVEDYAIPKESQPSRERPLTAREIKKFAQVAIAGPRVTINEQGVVMTPDEIASQRADDERVGRY